MPINKFSKRLQNLKWIPWRWRKCNGLLNTVLYVHLRRLWLKHWVLRNVASKPDDVTVIIGTLGKKDHRLYRTLQSLRQQTYPAELIKICVVDYGNEPGIAAWIKEVTEEYQVQYLRTENRGCWNHSHCSNVAMRRATTKYILNTDLDIMFAPNYIEAFVQALKGDTLGIVRAPTHDLLEEANVQLKDLTRPLNMAELFKLAELRPATGFGVSGTYTEYYKLIRGYDEFYDRWGGEDNDVRNRFYWLGLREISLENISYYLHQWHPRYEGYDEKVLEETRRKNVDYLHHAHTILRNDENWGQIIGPSSASTN